MITRVEWTSKSHIFFFCRRRFFFLFHSDIVKLHSTQDAKRDKKKWIWRGGYTTIKDEKKRKRNEFKDYSSKVGRRKAQRDIHPDTKKKISSFNFLLHQSFVVSRGERSLWEMCVCGMLIENILRDEYCTRWEKTGKEKGFLPGVYTQFSPPMGGPLGLLLTSPLVLLLLEGLFFVAS